MSWAIADEVVFEAPAEPTSWKNLYARIKISGPEIAASRYQQGAFAQAIAEETRRLQALREDEYRRRLYEVGRQRYQVGEWMREYEAEFREGTHE